MLYQALPPIRLLVKVNEPHLLVMTLMSMSRAYRETGTVIMVEPPKQWLSRSIIVPYKDRTDTIVVLGPSCHPLYQKSSSIYTWPTSVIVCLS